MSDIPLQDFSLCMYYGPGGGNTPLPPPGKSLTDTREQHVSDDTVFKVFMMSLMSIYKLQRGSKCSWESVFEFIYVVLSIVLPGSKLAGFEISTR